MSVNASKQDFLKGFRKHRNAYNAAKSASINDCSRRLLLVYSVECGLKYLYLKSLNANSVADLPAQSIISHNLEYFLKELRAGSYIFPPIKTEHGDTVTIREYHQLCRYSIPWSKKNPKDNTEYEHIEQYDRNLEAIMEWIEKQPGV